MPWMHRFLALSLLGVSLVSQAALFDDTEARKKILDVEAKSQAGIAELKKSQAAIEKRLASIEAVILGQGLADMQNQLESLKQEVAQLRGDLELAAHNLDAAQQRQKDLYADTDTRLRRIEAGPAPVQTADSTVSAQPPAEEKDVKAFAEAEALTKSVKHKEAFAAYDAFLKEYPTSKLVPDALFGMGYAQFALKNYKSSIATQQKLMDAYAEHAKAPEAMYNVANSQIQLGQITNAKKTLKELMVKYPNAEVIPTAQKQLKALEALK
ncbi:MAG: tol-pal system protein [Methylophilales bacterium 28-44-11]|nr:MAG: tol-pal system protein [Methylophilales bacterium 28-44-11]